MNGSSGGTTTIGTCGSPPAYCTGEASYYAVCAGQTPLCVNLGACANTIAAACSSSDLAALEGVGTCYASYTTQTCPTNMLPCTNDAGSLSLTCSNAAQFAGVVGLGKCDGG